MPTPAPTAERVRKRRDALRAAGLRPVQIWVPDTRRPGFANECRRQSRLVAEADIHNADLGGFLDTGLPEWKSRPELRSKLHPRAAELDFASAPKIAFEPSPTKRRVLREPTPNHAPARSTSEATPAQPPGDRSKQTDFPGSSWATR